MAPTGQAYDVDWVYSNNSNVHVAQNIEWFDSFTDFRSSDGSLYFEGDGSAVEGIDQVTLPVMTHRHRKGAAHEGTLVLKDVLYAPGIPCNILDGPISDEYNVTYGHGMDSIRDCRTGADVAIMDDNKLLRLRLVGQSGDQTSLD